MVRTEDLIIVSVDDHVVEPSDLFAKRVPSRYQAEAPKLIDTPTGLSAWEFEGRILPIGHVGPESFFRPGIEPTVRGDGNVDFRIEEIRPGCYDIHERVRDMNLNGQLGSLCFPQMARFAGQVFTEARDKGLSLAALRAYNDWHVEEWAGTYPGRIIPLGVVPMWSPDLMAKEVHRLAAMGCHAVTFSISPFRLGLPSLHDQCWDPFWRSCADCSTVICMHLGSDSVPPVTSPDAPLSVRATLSPLSTLYGAADLIWSQVFRRFPVKVALSEGGIGWIPWMLERIDYSHRAQATFNNQDFGERQPSDVFREHVVACFIDDRHGVQSRHEIGIETICVEVDYPHSDSSWPKSPEVLSAALAGLPDDEVRLLTHENAMRHFQFDPFKYLPPEECTVGFLRGVAGSHGNEDQRC